MNTADVTPKYLRTLAAFLRSSYGEQMVNTPENRATLADWIDAAAALIPDEVNEAET